VVIGTNELIPLSLQKNSSIKSERNSRLSLRVYGEEKISISERFLNADPVDLALLGKKKSMHSENDMCTIDVTVMQVDLPVMKNMYERKLLQKG